MNNTSKTLVFFGSGPVAAASLQHLLLHFNFEYIVTKRRPLHHHDPAPVEDLATANHIDLLYADNSIELNKITASIKFTSQVGLVIDYGVIITPTVINKFKHGIVNSHFSLLPQWRGADPITFALLAGQDKTGVCLMVINSHLDTGDLIACHTCPIAPDDDNQILTTKLINISNNLFGEYLPKVQNGEFILSAQPGSPIAYSKKIAKADGQINWTKPASVIEREIRAYSNWPTSYCRLGDIDVIITKALAITSISLQSGQIVISDQKTLQVGCRVDALEILELKPLGKNTMPVSAFINGYKDRLEF